MANEYKLSFTAQEIDERLGEIDNLSTSVNQFSTKIDENDIPKVFIDGNIPTDKYNKTEVLAKMRYISKTDDFNAYIKIKLQGSSSLWYSKLNYTVKMYSDDARENKFKKAFKDWGYKTNKYVLKANFIDHSHARNIVSARLWDEIVSSRNDYETLPEEMKHSPRNGAIDGFPIKLYYNGTYQGIYTWNIGKDDWMWGMDEDNPNHVLLCAETNDNHKLTEKSSSFRALWNGSDGTDWSIEVGTNSDAVKNSLNALIDCVMNTTDEEFKNQIGQYLDVQSALDYYLFSYVTCGIDSLAKNMLLATYDGTKWICGQYDMDSTFGSNVGGSINVSAECKCPEGYQEQYSLLWERIESLYGDELKARYNELRGSILSYPNMVAHFERFMDIIGKDLYAEDVTIYTDIPSADINNITQIRNFIRDRLVYVDGEIEWLGEHLWTTVEGIDILDGYQASMTMYTLSGDRCKLCVVNNGVIPLKKSVSVADNALYDNRYPIAIPDNASSIKVTAPSAQVWLHFYNYVDGATVYTTDIARFKASEEYDNGVVYDFEAGKYQYVSVHLERASDFPSDYDYSAVTVSFK